MKAQIFIKLPFRIWLCLALPFFATLSGACVSPYPTGGDTENVLMLLFYTDQSSSLSVSASASSVLIYEQATFSASGGIAPYTFSVTSGGGTITATGGVYTAGALLGTQTITATDATGLTGQGTITVNGGSGNGSFQNTDGSNSLSAPTQPERIEAGDFDADGFVDIAVVTNNGTLHIFKSNGDGTFQSSLTSTVDSSGREFSVADLNGDGKLDVVVGVANVNEMSVFLGNGDLTFQAKVDYAGESGWEGTTVGDFDNDGILDVVGTSDPNDNISFYKGNGDGTFQTYSTTGSINRPFHAESADLNLDGNLDLVVPNYSGAPSTSAGASVFLGKGDGTFQSPVEYATNTNSRSVAIAELNNDGKLDLATANNGAANISVLLGNGDGTFQTAIDTAVGNNPYDLAACDMNSDGVMDLVVGSEGSARVDVLFGNNNGTFAAQTPFTGAGGPKDMICRDFNNDGIMDVATPTVNNHVLRVYMGN